MIIRTCFAVCDDFECGENIDIPLDSLQPYLFLLERGWRNVVEGDKNMTYCPKHADPLSKVEEA